MSMSSNRREFMKVSALTGVGYWAMSGNASKAQPLANDKLAAIGIGVGGKGTSDIASASKYCDIVAVCDVDKDTLDKALKAYPKSKGFTDFRKIFDEMEKSFDVAVVSTPDHTHAAAALMAMRAKKHCYTQKPLTRTIYEARLMGDVAREMGVVTQMGNQGSGNGNGLREGAEQLRNGVLGTIQAVHVWTNRPVWAQAPNRRMTMDKFAQQTQKDAPDEASSIIAEKQKEIDQTLTRLDWENWIGTAPMRPFWPGLYHTFQWRGWWDFGSGALGDMACHTVNLPYAGCDLRFPTSVIAKSSGHDFDSFPASAEIVFEFPSTDWRPAIKFFWYDGGILPSKEILAKYGMEKSAKSGCLIIGEKGAMYSPDDYGAQWDLLAATGGTKPELVKGEDVKIKFPRNEGGHDAEFYRAVKLNKPELCFSNFPGYAGPLTETILLGNLAMWAASNKGEWGEKVEWDAKNLAVTNLSSLKTPGVADLIKPVYRSGFRLD